MKDFFKQLFEYNYYTNQQLANEFLVHQQEVPQKAVQLYSHILNAHRNWNRRVLPNQDRIDPWQIHSILDFHRINKVNFENTTMILNSNSLEEVIEFAFNVEQTFENTIGNLLFHVINHSTYHRAQIATEFRISGITPLSTDYSTYSQKPK
ncbi:DinB family protein [Desertivirga arenae]|uniref:DinB family protein n=1 Tax=Desertivirga arenae TaxID=2810309 RepID=UPI001A971DB4|nr:DinB family protein [Pedobacter sp. SYSU D00823]